MMMLSFPLRRFLSCALVCALCLAASGHAAESVRRQYDLPAEPAEAALKRLATQSGLEVLFGTDLVAGVRTRAVKAEVTAVEAARLLLDGTGLEAVQDERTGALNIRRAAPPPSEPGSGVRPRTDEPRPARAAAAGVAAGTAAAGEDGRVVVLNPFTVSAETDEGYRANSTLSGTRINTSLRDIGTSIQAITQEFLEDTGVTDATTLLQYTTSTEVSGGAGGNFSNASGSSAVFSSDTNNRATSTPTRIRGLAGASISRGLYPTSIPFDSYNISRVEINRGANSVLFGLGSPAGIINYSVAEPLWHNTNTVEARVDNFGSFRAVLDLNRVLVKDKLALRVIGLNNETKYKQDPAFRDDRRYFLTASYRPFRNTTLTASFEKGWIDSTMPRQDPPRDYLTHYFTTGMVSVPNNTDYRDMPAGTAYISLDSGAIGNLRIFDSPTSGGTGNAFVQYPETYLGGGVINPRATNPARANDFRYRRVAMQNGREFLLNVYGDPLGPNAYALGLVDPSVFDFFNNNIDGNASFQFGRIEAGNVALRQEFLNGNAGLELGYDKQKYDNGYVDALDGIRGNALMLDLSGGEFGYAVPGDPSSGQAVNPNYLRPNVGSRGNFADRYNEDDTLRATAFLRHDFAENSDGFLARLLGRQNLTLLASSYQSDAISLSGQPSFMDYNDLRALGWSDVNARANQAGQLGNIFYLGPSIAGRTTASGLGLTGYKGDFRFPDTVNIAYRDGSTRQIATAPVRVHHYNNEPHDRLATSASLARDTLDTLAAVLQSYWWEGGLVSTVGWREDRVKRYTYSAFARRPDQTILFDRNALDTNNPLNAVTGSTATYSGVVKANTFIGRWLPRGVDLDFHYGWSENFQGLVGARNMSGGFYDAPVGETQERGFSVGLFNQKLFFRANWFETEQRNLTDADIDQAITTVTGQLPSRLYAKYTLAQLQAVGFQMPPMLAGSYTLSEPNADGYVTRNSLYTPRDIKSAVSKGFELEATYNVTKNWRVAVNAAQMKSTEDGKGTNWAATAAWVKANWFDKPSVATLSTGEGGSLDPVSGWEQRAITDFLSALERNGASNPEIREWRVNAVTNYTFPRTSRLAGFGVGGGARYQDNVFIGYRGKPNPADPAGTYIADVTKPQFGPSETNFDFWVSYERKIFKTMVWKLQLNIRNAFTNDELIPVQAQQVDVYSKYAAFDNYKASGYMLYRIAAPRTIELRSTLKF